MFVLPLDLRSAACFQILVRAAEQPRAGQSCQRLFVHPGQDALQDCQPITFASHCARCSGVNAAISMPQRVNLPVICLS